MGLGETLLLGNGNRLHQSLEQQTGNWESQLGILAGCVKKSQSLSVAPVHPSVKRKSDHSSLLQRICIKH